MKKEQLLKAGLIFGGGFLLFYMIKTMKQKSSSSTTASFLGKKSADASVTPDPENAKIVQTAYAEALTAGETPARLSELNKECMKEFGMRCYVDESGKIIVCDINGNTIL